MHCLNSLFTPHNDVKHMYIFCIISHSTDIKNKSILFLLYFYISKYLALKLNNHCLLQFIGLEPTQGRSNRLVLELEILDILLNQVSLSFYIIGLHQFLGLDPLGLRSGWVRSFRILQ